MNISLPTGMVISVSCYDYYFILKDEDCDEFFQQCIADNLGIDIQNPFSSSSMFAKITEEEIDDISI